MQWIARPNFNRIAKGLQEPLDIKCSALPFLIDALRECYNAGLERAAEIADYHERRNAPHGYTDAIRAEKAETDLAEMTLVYRKAAVERFTAQQDLSAARAALRDAVKYNGTFTANWYKLHAPAIAAAREEEGEC